MKKRKSLVEARELAFKNADALVKKAEEENRALSQEEQDSLASYNDEVVSLTSQIEQLDLLEENRSKIIPATHSTQKPTDTKDHRDLAKNFSMLKALRSVVQGGSFSGAEAEMNAEGLSEQREVGVGHLVSGGGLNIPAAFMDTRANEQVVNPPEQGGYTVESRLAEVIPILRPEMALRDAGATFLTGLQGDLDFTNQATGVQATWKGEIEALDQGTQTFAQRTMKPKRLGTWVPISMQLLAQSSIDMENFVRADISDAIAQALEIAALNGSGVAPVPLGVLNTSGVPTVPIGTDGGALTFDKLVDMETEIFDANANRARLAYLVNAKTRGQLKKERQDPGSGLFTWAGQRELLNGFDAHISNNLPDNLTKGTGTDLSAAVFGNWRDLLIGNWGGVQIVMDPYTKAIEGQVVLTTNTFWDVLVRRPESFVKVVDIDTTA